MVSRHTLSSLLFSLILLSFHSCSSSLFNLERGHSLSVEDAYSTFLTSPDNTFACGFYGLGTNAYWFAIWFANSRDKTVVWVANRARPVNSKGSKVKLEKNGALTLTDVDGAMVWESNTTSTRVNMAELLDTGNLVLRNPQGVIVWQSFDSPTDTLLPSQVFTKNNRLISVLKEGSFEPGYFSLYFDGDNVLKLIYDGPEVSGLYWPNPDFDSYGNQRTSQNSTRIAYLDNLGRFFSSDRQVQILYLNASDAPGDLIKRRMKLDVDGNLRIYSLQDSTGLWKVTWQALLEPCGVHGICGRNALCNYALEPVCSCPPGYVVVNSSDWSKGCKALFNLTDLVTRPVKFLEVSQVDYWGFDLNYTKPFSMEDCRNLCLKDHNCMAFSYRRNGEAKCYTKGTLYNGYRSPDFPGSIFLKLPRDFPVPESGRPVILTRANLVCPNVSSEVLFGSPSMYDVTSKKVRWVYLYSFCSALGGIELLVFVLGWWALFSKHGIPASLENGYCMLSSQFRRFTYAELKKATKNFKVELGRGGSGAVYKGVLVDGREVAVKRLGDEFQGEEQFWAEMTTIGKINHMNLVRMWGFCAKGKHRLLVYEYVENSSLDKHIYTSNFLGWKERFEVALGTAKGLAYLHHECLEWVIHCDVKPENILLNGEFEPKIADFGLAKLSQRDDPGSYFTKIRGTKGYMAPEWALNQPITSKVDVFGYGVVILEMVKGSRLSSWAAEESEHQQETADLKQFLWAMKSKVELTEETWVDDMVDKRLEGKFSRNQAKTLIKIGVACVEEDRNMRPTMAYVVQTLLECEDETTLQTPDVLHI